jgi:hypothetical protein
LPGALRHCSCRAAAAADATSRTSKSSSSSGEMIAAVRW